MKTTIKAFIVTVLNSLILIILFFANFSSANALVNEYTQNSFSSEKVALVAFNKTFPANGATIATPTNSYMALQWTDALIPASDRYQYCIDTTNNNSCDGNKWVTRKTLFSGGPGDINFVSGTTYYWQVRARDSGITANSGAWWSFTTSGSPPPATFNKTAPANGSTIAMPASTYYLLQWTDLGLPSTDRYQYCIDTTNNNSCDGNNWITRNSLYSGSGEFTLAYGTTYYWQVKARDAGTLANGGAWWSFTVSNPAIVGFSKTFPANGATIATPTNSYMALQWTDALIPASDRYQYCIDTTNNNSCDGNKWVTRKTLFSGGPGDINFVSGTTYYWQVRARDSGITANSGAWWSFTTSGSPPPATFNKTAPANGSTIAMPASTYYLLQWTDLGLPSTDRYQYCIDTTNNNSCDGNNWITRNSLYSGSGEFTLAYGTTYYWQVKARDAGTLANGGAWWSFTIEALAPAPNVVNIQRASANPTNAASVDFTVTFSQSVSGVDIGDFQLNATIGDASITNVSGTGATRTVTVNTGSISGTIRLDFIDNDSVQNSQTTPVGGVGAGNGNFTSGEIYTINKP